MKKEVLWNRIEEVTAKRSTCISRSGSNHSKAEQDFRNFPDKISYYTFYAGKQGRGYVRTITEGDKTFIDFVSPYGQGYMEVVAKHLAKKLPNVYIPVTNAPDKFKNNEAIPTHRAWKIQQRVYTLNAEMSVKVE